YAKSKHEFDLWALSQEKAPFYWKGLKFFNVYGSNEGHKGKMASMVYQMKQQISETGKVRLFKSYHSEYANGEQKRDFIHVDKVVAILFEYMLNRNESGIFNVGTGTARSFNEMAYNIFDELKMHPSIEYIEMPEAIKDKYQYFTEAKL
ncbi:MAG: NAD-dependent epimerase/dehydratase family protein, partial [Marinoscillum sp.]